MTAHNPVAVRKALCENSLYDFTKTGWKYIDPATFVDGRHLQVISQHLEAVYYGQIRRLMINVPPRHCKSLLCSVAFPAWIWANDPTKRFLSFSYAQALSTRDSLKHRRLVESPWYQSLWGKQFSLTGDQNTKIRFDNDQGGFRMASSITGLGTGEGGDIILIDDPHNMKEIGSDAKIAEVIDFWTNVLPTRLNDPKTGAFVIIMQRGSERDLCGHIIQSEYDDWVHINLPARYEVDHPYPSTSPFGEVDWRTKDGEFLWGERFGKAELDKIARTMGSFGAAGQLQQRPAPREGGLFDRAWFDGAFVDRAPKQGQRIRYWDKAATEEKPGLDPDWTAGALLNVGYDGVAYLEDMVRFRDNPAGVERRIKQTAQMDGRGVHVYLEQEPGSSGKDVISYYQRHVLAGFVMRGDRPTGSKVERAAPLSAAAEAGNLKIVRGGWNHAFLDELCAFPYAAHDDQVDAASGAYAKLVKTAGGEPVTHIMGTR